MSNNKILICISSCSERNNFNIWSWIVHQALLSVRQLSKHLAHRLKQLLSLLLAHPAWKFIRQLIEAFFRFRYSNLFNKSNTWTFISSLDNSGLCTAIISLFAYRLTSKDLMMTSDLEKPSQSLYHGFFGSLFRKINNELPQYRISRPWSPHYLPIGSK